MNGVSEVGTFLFFPPKCLLCDDLLFLEKEICTLCSTGLEEIYGEGKIPYLHKWASLWYYEETVRESILRYKFERAVEYAPVYGKHLAGKIRREGLDRGEFILSYIPISRQRYRQRGYDQVELLARFVGRELGVTPQITLQKVRHNIAQSLISDPAKRRANVLGAYRPVCPESFRGKRVLILDDIMTTGATACECAKVLSLAGAGQVDLAVLASGR